MTENELSKIAVDAAFHIHTTLGLGLLESVNQKLIIELKSVPKITPVHKNSIHLLEVGGLPFGITDEFW